MSAWPLLAGGQHRQVSRGLGNGANRDLWGPGGYHPGRQREPGNFCMCLILAEGGVRKP